MAFSSSTKSQSLAGSLRMETIAFNAAGVTTGVASAHMSHIDCVVICNETSGVVAGQKAAVDGQQITLSGLNSNDVGTLLVIGH